VAGLPAYGGGRSHRQRIAISKVSAVVRRGDHDRREQMSALLGDAWR